MECISPVHFHGLEPGEHHFEVRAHRPGRARSEQGPDAGDATTGRSTPSAEDRRGRGPTRSPRTRGSPPAPAPRPRAATATFSFAGSDNPTPGLEPRPSSAGSTAGRRGLRAVHRRRRPTPASASARTPSRCGRSTARATSTRRRPSTPGRSSSRPRTPRRRRPTIDSRPGRVTVRTDATFTFSSDDADRDASSARSTAAAVWRAVHLAQGVHRTCRSARASSSVRAMDPAGNADPTPATYTWQVGVRAGARPGLLRPDDHRRASGPERPGRLPLGRPRHRRAQHHDRPRRPHDRRQGLGAGIRNDGYDNVTIKNGRVADFDYGVMLNPAPRRTSSSA